MKILVREYDAENRCNYVWKKVATKMKSIWGGIYQTDDGYSYDATEILKITHDFRKSGYVVCSGCNQIVKKDKLIKHYEDQERNANCAKCDWLRVTKAHEKKRRIGADFNVVIETVGKGVCSEYGYSYRGTPLSEVDKPAQCKYFACRRSEVMEIKDDFLSMYPNPFKLLLTENAIINSGWKYMNNFQKHRTYSNKDGRIVAYFDTNGILSHFLVMKRSDSYRFVYSDVYDKFIDPRGNEFTWGDLAERTVMRYSKAIRELYKK